MPTVCTIDYKMVLYGCVSTHASIPLSSTQVIFHQARLKGHKHRLLQKTLSLEFKTYNYFYILVFIYFIGLFYFI